MAEGKSVLLAAPKATRDHLSDALAPLGVELKGAHRVLGLDLSWGTRRRITVSAARLRSGAQRRFHLAPLALHAREKLRFARAGASAAALWGVAVAGLAPTRVAKERAGMLRSAGLLPSSA